MNFCLKKTFHALSYQLFLQVVPGEYPISRAVPGSAACRNVEYHLIFTSEGFHLRHIKSALSIFIYPKHCKR